MGHEGKRWGIIAACGAIAVLCVALMCGCNSYEPKTTSDEATAFYQGKYGIDATVTEEHGLCNYDLFTTDWGGTEYIMSDGCSVVYIDSEGEFSDNRQSQQIAAAAFEFASTRIESIPGAITSFEVRQVGELPSFANYDGKGACWHNRYDGDIEAFLRAEHPYLSFGYNGSGQDYAEGRFSYDVAFDASGIGSLEQVERDWLALDAYFDINHSDLAIVQPQAIPQLASGELGLFDDGFVCLIEFRRDDAGRITATRFKPALVTLFPGATVSSQTAGVTLQEGDIRFEPLGNGFYRCHISGQAAGRKNMIYYIFDDSPAGLTQITGIDRFSNIVDAGEHRSNCYLVDGGTYYLGDASDVHPYVQVESMTEDRIVISYHTIFKDRIKRVDFKTVGLVLRDEQGGSTTHAFDSRIIEETSDGWRCEIEIPENAKRENELYFQFSYNGNDNVDVQIIKKLTLP
ncbi:MAG: hypothetical protein IJH83_04775 [Coriobacteriales bacterium]|nr:hypothetical protein [Coriobacteriales bacterium]